MISGYLDPASGSAIISAVVAGAAGAGVAARTVMAKMRFKKSDEGLVVDGPDIGASELSADEVVDESTL